MTHDDAAPVPRPNLFTNGDQEAWCEQFRILFYVARLTPMQIAQIDYGLDPDHADAWMAFLWAQEIAETFPRLEFYS